MEEMVSVVVPCYNESARIGLLLDDLLVLSGKGLLREVVFVDDGSVDDTVEVIRRYPEELPMWVVRLGENRGKWAAVRRGLLEVKRRRRSGYVLICDADGGVGLWGALPWIVKGSEKVYVGSRFLPGSEVVGKGLFRAVVSRGYRWYVRLCCWYATGSFGPDDMQCPYKLVPVRLLGDWVQGMEEERFAGDLELMANLLRRGAVVESVPIRFAHRGGGHIGLGAMVQMAVATARIARKQRFLRLTGLRGSASAAGD